MKLNEKSIKEYSYISVGIFLISVGTFLFEFPNSISSGGVTGLSIVLHQIFENVSVSNFVGVFNAALLIIAFFVLGKGFAFKTIYGAGLLTVFLQIFEIVQNIIGLELPLTEQPVLELIFATVLSSVGLGIVLFFEGSSGGTDIVALIIRRFTGLDSGKALFVSDILLVLLTFYDFSSYSAAITTGLMSLCAFSARSFTVNCVLNYMNRSHMFLIFTEKRLAVEEYITTNLSRGATSWRCEGAYTHKASYAVSGVVSAKQARGLREFLKRNDPDAFIIESNPRSIIGRGFRQI